MHGEKVDEKIAETILWIEWSTGAWVGAD